MRKDSYTWIIGALSTVYIKNLNTQLRFCNCLLKKPNPKQQQPTRVLPHRPTLYAACLASTTAKWLRVVLAVETDAVPLQRIYSEVSGTVVSGIPGQVL